jgi:hypothetical protein
MLVREESAAPSRTTADGGSVMEIVPASNAGAAFPTWSVNDAARARSTPRRTAGTVNWAS